MELGEYQDAGIDVFGDAYEYLMAMYASSAGKSGGEFFTPQEVSELLAKIAVHNQESVNKVYDPCCGSGSLLLKFVELHLKSKWFANEIKVRWLFDFDFKCKTLYNFINHSSNSSKD